MKAKMDEIVEFAKLAYYLAMPLRTYFTGLRVRLARSVVTSIELEILLLGEGIGAVDAPFMAKASERLQELVKQPSILMACFELETSEDAPAKPEFPEELKDQREPHPKRVILFIQESHLLPRPLAEKRCPPCGNRLLPHARTTTR